MPPKRVLPPLKAPKPTSVTRTPPPSSPSSDIHGSESEIGISPPKRPRIIEESPEQEKKSLQDDTQR